jgi:hypothetical protein
MGLNIYFSIFNEIIMLTNSKAKFGRASTGGFLTATFLTYGHTFSAGARQVSILTPPPLHSLIKLPSTPF